MAPHSATAAEPQSEPPPPPMAGPLAASPPLQFSLRFLLLAMTVTAIALAVLSWGGAPIFAILVAVALYFVAPVSLGTLAIYCRGFRQTLFAGMFVGATAPMILGTHLMMGRGDVTAWALGAVVQLVAAGACGATAVTTRRFLERRGWDVAAVRRSKIPPE